MKRRKPIKIEAIRPGIPMEDYLALDAIGHSDLEALSLSPADAYLGMTEEEDSSSYSDARDFGTAIHLALLEPALYPKRVGFLPPTFNGRTKDGQALKKQMESTYEVVLKAEREDNIRTILQNVKNCPPFANILSLPGEAEMTATVQDPETGVMCKCRPDRLLPGERILFDLKTTRAKTKRQFAKQSFDLGYDRKMAYYLRLLRWLREKGKTHAEYDYAVIGAVQNSGAFNVGIFVLTPEDLETAWQSLRPLLNRAATCVETGYWPGWDSEPTTLNYEKWMKDRRLAQAEE
jgi:exodeoxyribonuclease VIII